MMNARESRLNRLQEIKQRMESEQVSSISYVVDANVFEASVPVTADVEPISTPQQTPHPSPLNQTNTSPLPPSPRPSLQHYFDLNSSPSPSPVV